VVEPVAIIGMGCRFPGAPSPAAFWDLLRDGRRAIRTIPAERPGAAAFLSAPPALRDAICAGGFLDGIEQFDAKFFGICDDEARAMDPQQRLLLEVAWEAIADAGISHKALAGTDTGVFAGISSLNYGCLAQMPPASLGRFTNTGGGASIAANRISYFFDLRGPSFAIDAACASSLLAVHLACRSLRTGECRLALAGGANAILIPGTSIAMAAAGLLSPDGNCRVFDAAANGVVRGEGAGMVVLKLLDHAVADGDSIYAVIRGSAMSHNGRSNGLTGPSRWAQEAVLREAYRRADIDPRDVQYVEAHSTGTLIGDATELTALAAVLGQGRSGRPFAVGSTKPNIGHLEAASGVAALIKLGLMFEHACIPPLLNLEKPNSYARIDPNAIALATTMQTWEGERVAGISAAGYGGANVHLVLTSSPVAKGKPRGGPVSPFKRRRYWLENAEAATAPRVDAQSPNSRPAPSPAGAPVAARDEVEKRLVRIWQEILEVSPIGVADSFFDLGGTSVMALRLFAAIEQELGAALPLASLYSSPTIEQLAALLRHPQHARVWEPMVLLNGQGARTPLFFVPGLGGHAFDLRALAHKLGEGQPMYVLHPQGLDPAQTPLTRIEEMAAAFLKHVRAVQSCGPYQIGGYSFGGSVAYEMARQLHAKGESVSLLALLDAYAPEAFRKRSLPRRLVTHVQKVWGLEGTSRRQYLRDRAGRIWARMRRARSNGESARSSPSLSVIDAVQRVTDANQVAWQSYRPGPYSGAITLFRAHPREESVRIFCDSDPTNGWAFHASHVDVIQLPCDHLQLFEPAPLEFMAGELRARLDRQPQPVGR